MKINLKFKILAVLLFLSLGFFYFTKNSAAAIINATSCLQVDVQNAINVASDGDVVVVPKGSCTWTSTVNIPNLKGITIDGNGVTINGQIILNQNTNTSTRITRFNFTKNNTVRVFGSKASAPFRIDHNTFTSVDGGSTLLEVSGNAPGLIDNNSFNSPLNSEIIHNMGLGASDDSGWSDDIIPGSPDAVYLEDNTFTNNDPGLLTENPAYFWGNSAIQSYYGSRTVVRHNKMIMSQIDQHGTPGMIGARWWEIYENTFDNVKNGSQCCYMSIRAGSGVIFNNHKIGYSNPWDVLGTIGLIEEDPGYPALYQIGRGKNQVLDPAYVWSNDVTMVVGSGSANVVVNRDFYLSARPGYIPYTYPHPLQGVSDITPPSAPTGLSVI